jgi:mitochondrial import receptor subunit TOM40
MGAAISYCSPQQALSAAICVDEKSLDYNHLPCPVKYEDITREAYMSLKPELFEGLRFDMTRSLNKKFALSNR